SVGTGAQTGSVVSYHKKGETRMFAGTANYELTTKQRASVEAFNSAAGTLEPAVDDTDSSTGPLALGDVYGDGTLCLFVGGRVVPGRYPEPATSRLYRERD